MKPVVEDPEKLICLYDCVDTALFKLSNSTSLLEEMFPESKGKTKIATIAALVDHKDIPTFISMAEKLLKHGQHDLHFFIIGDGTLKKFLSDVIIQKGIQSNVHLTGFIKDIPSVLKGVDVYVFTQNQKLLVQPFWKFWHQKHLS
jgi:glycosyltransferase involved in cell wall biosynthesis